MVACPACKISASNSVQPCANFCGLESKLELLMLQDGVNAILVAGLLLGLEWCRRGNGLHDIGTISAESFSGDRLYTLLVQDSKQ